MLDSRKSSEQEAAEGGLFSPISFKSPLGSVPKPKTSCVLEISHEMVASKNAMILRPCRMKGTNGIDSFL